MTNGREHLFLFAAALLMAALTVAVLAAWLAPVFHSIQGIFG